MCLLCEIRIEFTAGIQHNDIWATLDANPRVREGVPDIICRFPVIPFQPLDLLERGSPAQTVEVKVLDAFMISFVQQVQTHDMVEPVRLGHSRWSFGSGTFVGFTCVALEVVFHPLDKFWLCIT